MSLVAASSTVALDQQTAAAYYPQFVQRVSLSAAAVALAVLAEATTTTGHAARSAYARMILLNPPIYASQSIVWAVVADLVTGSGATDQQLLDRVAALWDKLSATS